MALALAAVAGAPTALASLSADQRPPPRRINGKKQPSVAEVQRAIGITDGTLRSPSGQDSSIMDLIASTPIGQTEGTAEKKLREASEWVVDHIESRALAGQQIFLVACLKTLPVWLFLLLVASGIIKLPFDLPLLDDLIL